MTDTKQNPILQLLSIRIVIAFIVSLALLFSVQAVLSAKPAPDTSADLPDRAVTQNVLEQHAVTAAPTLPEPTAPISLPATIWRINIITDGLYILDYSTLAQGGVPVTGSLADDYHLLWRGQEVALDGIGIADTTFDPGDAFIFYGEKYHGSTQGEKYTDENVYWLSISSDTPGLRVSQRDVSPTSMLPAAETCTDTTNIEENLLYWARHTIYPFTETTWFWEKIPHQTGITTTYEITLSRPTANLNASLEVEVAAKASGKHSVRLAVNETYLGEWVWYGSVGTIINTAIPSNTLIDGANDLHIYTDDLRETLYFDRAEISYNRQPVATPEGLFCVGNLSNPATYTMTAVPAGAYLYDISDILRPVALTNTYTDAQNLIFRESLTQEITYVLQNPQTTTVSAYAPRLDLISPTVGADQIMIAPEHFLDALAPLIAHRESQGLRVRPVAVEDIYPLFNGGIFHPEAIRSFVTHAYTSWPGDPVKYLFLVGDGNFNLKGYNPASYGAFTPSWIPPYLAFDDPTQGEVPVDSLFGDVSGDGFPEVMVGRLPAQTVDEVTAYVNKILAYEAQPAADWQGKALLVADNGNGGVDEGFDSLLVRLKDYIPSYIKITDIFMETYCDSDIGPCPEASQAVTESWNAGTALLLYSGHGAVNRWAHEPLLYNEDLATLTETEKLPFLVSLDCWDGYWMFPPTYPSLTGRDLRSMGEWVTTVLTETGAIANFGPAGLAYSYQQEAMAEAMLKRLFNDHELNLGAITQAGREAIQTSYLSRIMTLMGDPAMPLKIRNLDRHIYIPMVIRTNDGG